MGHVAIAIPVERHVSIHWAINLAKIIGTSPGTRIVYRSGTVIDVLRNALVKDVMGMPDTSHILFLDSDVIPHPAVIPTLLSHHYPITSGAYRSKTGVPGVWMKLPDGSPNRYMAIPADQVQNKVIMADAVGAGCLMVDMRLFKRVPEPWFEWTIREIDNPQGGMSEDFAFCKKVQEYTGLKVLVNGFLSSAHEGLSRINLRGDLEDWL